MFSQPIFCGQESQKMLPRTVSEINQATSVRQNTQTREALIPAETIIEIFQDINERRERQMPKVAPPYLPMVQSHKTVAA